MKRSTLAITLFLLSWLNAGAAAVTVTARPLGELLITREATAAATVVAANVPVVTSQVAALVESVSKDVGATVKKGELLVRLDSDNARLALAGARAALAAVDAQIVEAKARLANAEELLQKKFISDEELIARRAALSVLEANRDSQAVAVEAAQLELSRTRIQAPFDATIMARHAQVGGYVQPGSPILTLSQRSNLEVNAEIDQQYLESIRTVSPLEYVSRNQRWPVQLLRASDVLDPGSRMATGRFGFIADVAPAGSSGELVWNERSGLLPVELIVERGGELGVFVANSNTAAFIAIAGAQQGRPARVDLPAATLIITRGQTRLQDGDAIEVRRE